MSNGGLFRLTLDTNPDYCNLNCIMCEDHSPYATSRAERKQSGTLRPNMSPSLLEKTIRDAAAMGISEIIPSTMGEPLLYPHIELIFDLCQELNLRLNLTTNGTFPAPEKHHNVEYWAERIVPICNDVKISWNGARESTQANIMLGTSLEQHINHAKRFIAVRDRLQIDQYCSMTMQLTFMRSNLEEIPAMLELAIELGFDRLKGHQLWAHFAEIKNQNLRNNIAFAERWNQIARHCHAVVEQHNQSASRRFFLDNVFELAIDNLDDIAPNGSCPFLGKEVWVDPTGRFNVCCAPDQQRKTLGDFGNVNEIPLSLLVQNPAYQTLTATYLEKPLCQRCNMRRPA